MKDYSYVDRWSKQFNAGLKVFHAFRDRLKVDRISEILPFRFEVTNGPKPFAFDADWIGKTYHFAMIAEMQLIK